MSMLEKTCLPPTGPGPSPGVEGESVYERLRGEIIEGRLAGNERLKVSQLAARLGTSTNPVREALQQLRGEGLIVMSPNRGARVRPIDETFVRDISEIELLLEPALTRWFVGIVSPREIEALEATQAEIERLNFADPRQHNDLDTRFHLIMYGRHYNRHAVDLWWRHREILGAIARRFPVSLARRRAVIEDHRAVLDCLRRQDAAGAAETAARHVEGSAQHLIEYMRLSRTTDPGGAPDAGAGGSLAQDTPRRGADAMPARGALPDMIPQLPE